MGVKGCINRHKGHIVILLYFFLFGSGFLSSSSLYLHELYKIKSDPVPECVLGLLTHDNGVENGTNISPGGSIADCADVGWWLTIAWVGIIYGSICILAGLAKLFPILKRLCSCDAPAMGAVQEKLRPRRSSSFRDAAGGRTVARANAGVRQLVNERGNETRNWSSCSQFTRICLKFVIIMNLWLISIVMPWYIAVNIFNSDGIRAKDEHLYFPALCLFAISIVSLAVSLASCVFIIIEHDPGSWDDDEEDDADGDCEVAPVKRDGVDGVEVETKNANDPNGPSEPEEVEPLNPTAN